MRYHRWTWGRALVVATAASVLLGGLLIVLSGSKGTNPQQREGAPFESYPVRHLSPAELARRLRETLSTLHEEAEIVADNENQKILVRGPGANPRLITQLIQDV